MTVNEWVELIQRQGGVCNDYMRKLNAVTNKTEMFRVLCDVNGGAWLFELHAKGVQIPIDSFVQEFKNYINGKKTMEYPEGYKSKFHCRQNGTEIVADTTIVYVLECKDVNIVTPKNAYPTVILSGGSSAKITMNDGWRLNLELYGNARYELDGNDFNVKITKHRQQ